MKKKNNDYSKLFGLTKQNNDKKFSDYFTPKDKKYTDSSIKYETDEKSVVTDNSKIANDELNVNDNHVASSPALSKQFEALLKKNFRELSLIEGNLIDTQTAPKSIYCTSCFPGEGKTTTAIHMAYGLSQYSRKKVLLIDGNPTKPNIHNFFNVENDFGFQEVLSGSSKLSNVIISTSYQNLSIITSGENSKTLNYQNFESVINRLEQVFDYVILDGYAIYELSDPLNIATKIDGFIITVKCESTKWEIVQMVKDKLINAGGKIYGVTLNKRKFYISPLFYKILSNKRKNG